MDPAPQAKKTQKRRKKKKQEQSPRELLEHRGSTSSESEQRFLPEEQEEQLEEQEQVVQELHLTDDLTDSLMNPPTDPEQSDEEPAPVAAQDVNTDNVEQMEVEEELFANPEDQEVQEITHSLEEVACKVVEAAEAVPVVCYDVNKNITVVEAVQEVVKIEAKEIEVSEVPEEAVDVKMCQVEEIQPVEVEVCDTNEEEMVVEVNPEPVESAVSKTTEVAQTATYETEPKSRGKQRRGSRKERKVQSVKTNVVNNVEEKSTALTEAVKTQAEVVVSPSTELPKMSYSCAMKSNLTVEPSPAPLASPASKSPAPQSSHKEEARGQKVERNSRRPQSVKESARYAF